MRRSIEEDAKAAHYERAAEVASRYTKRRESLGTTLRRIEKLEASQRQIDRYIAEGRAPEGSGTSASTPTSRTATPTPVTAATRGMRSTRAAVQATGGGNAAPASVPARSDAPHVERWRHDGRGDDQAGDA
jgi:hypothetical protein